MDKPKPLFKCPNCRKAVERASADFPFCCERCRIADLGRWAAGEYRVPGEPVHLPSDLEDED